jgi:CheY-like chemotaxis protein
LDGIEVARLARQHRPDLPVLFATGYLHEPLLTQVEDRSGLCRGQTVSAPRAAHQAADVLAKGGAVSAGVLKDCFPYPAGAMTMWLVSTRSPGSAMTYSSTPARFCR